MLAGFILRTLLQSMRCASEHEELSTVQNRVDGNTDEEVLVFNCAVFQINSRKQL